MNAFLEDVLAAAAQSGPVCGVRTTLNRLREENPELATAFEATLNHPSAKSVHIADRLRLDGYELSEFTINRHRRGKCRCER